MPFILALALTLSAATVFAAVGTSNSDAQTGGHLVEIVGQDYQPFDLTIATGETVTWVNNGGAAHNVRAADDSFRSPFLLNGLSFSHTFPSSGDFEYRCSIHPFMVGYVRVRGEAVPTTPTATPTQTATPVPTARPDFTVTSRAFAPAVVRGD